MPLFAGIMSIPNIWIIKRVEFRTFVLMALMSLMIGNVIYGLANLANSKWFLLISRSIMGLFGSGPLIGWSFVARSFGVDKRSKFSTMMSSFTALGYSLGPFLGWALEKFANGLNIDTKVFDVSTVPAWFVVFVCFFMTIWVFACLENPPQIKSNSIPMSVREQLGSWTLKKNLANKYFGYLARCEFWAKIGLRFWILVGYVDILAKFGAKLSFRV